MSASKHFEKIAWIATALILAVTVLFVNGAALGIEVMTHTMGYENRLFDNSRVHTIDIVMNDWDEFIANATSEQYYTANMVIDGEAYKNVGIRGKGNTSLSTVSSLGSQRYSFKVEFDQYDNALTYHGLDKLSLNNLIQDSTMMKDYLAYTMMNEFGAASPLCSFVYITVNGEDWGLYLAVEGIEDSFLERNYGSDYGELYKPDSMSFGGGRGNGKGFDMNDFMGNFTQSGNSDTAGQRTDRAQMPDMGSFDPSSMFGGEMPDMDSFDFSRIPNMGWQGFGSEGSTSFEGGFNFGGMGGFGMGSSDVKLQYIDEELSSYSNIWNNAKTDITEADQRRLIDALETLSKGEDIGSVVDIEQVIRYFVVHNFVCNGDSYTGSMIHNYYLYEEDGVLSMLPWDYNLAFGTFQGGNGQSTVNTPIDAPVSGGAGEDRPMWSWILSDEMYTEIYHRYFSEFLNTVDVVGIIDHAYGLIKSYVAKDPTAFYTYEEFETGVETMRQFCTLRTQSISLQLANGETASNMNYVDASGLTLSDMGSMSGMGGFGGGKTDRENGKNSFTDRESFGKERGASTADEQSVKTTVVANATALAMNMSQMPNMGQMPEGFDPSQMPNMGQMPEGFDPSQMIPGQSSGGTVQNPSDGAGSSGNTGSSGSSSRPSAGSNMQIPGFNTSGTQGSSSAASGWKWIAISVLVLGAGLVVAKAYRY